ncbi:Rho GTPase-activating protein 2 [Ranunculus cassubicifolius]
MINVCYLLLSHDILSILLTCQPSCSISVFGVSAESIQCSYDPKGNSVPTILLLMQERLYTQGGLKAEGIFRINPENSPEEHVRDQPNRGIVPKDIDVHCLAGLIKAWFRELPEGILDGLSPEQVCNELLPIQAALLSWAVDLMADVVEEEELNKMNARNIAMVFAPNMTQMSDPLTALMHAVQVMNLLKTLIIKTLRGVRKQQQEEIQGRL